MNLVPLIINLVCGAVGGNGVAAVVKKLDLGLLGNSIAGIIGGGLGGQLLGLLGIEAGADGAADLSSIVGNVASGGVGGGVVLAIVGVVKNLLAKSSAS